MSTKWLLKRISNQLIWNLKELDKINKIKITYFKSLARTLWPNVTKDVSWFDINQAKEDTLWCRCSKISDIIQEQDIKGIKIAFAYIIKWQKRKTSSNLPVKICSRTPKIVGGRMPWSSLNSSRRLRILKASSK